jgi:hypothetical protein
MSASSRESAANSNAKKKKLQTTITAEKKQIARLEAQLKKNQKALNALKTPPPAGGGPKAATALGLYGYRWNLPPHAWSVPVEAQELAGGFIADKEKAIPATRGYTQRYRRGRIYWYARVENEYLGSTKRNSGDDPRYGFQFMWNPQSVQTSVAINMDITPTFADKFVDVVGAFPSGEMLAIELRLDRTNDFASFKDLDSTANSLSYLANSSAIQGYYNPAWSFDQQFSATLQSKLVDLMELGTIADLEYLYKAINGPGWTNVATGRKSSEIGFLRPALLRIDLGPSSYLGYITNLVVNHVAFNKAMIPIRTDVAIQFNLMATAGLSSKK